MNIITMGYKPVEYDITEFSGGEIQFRLKDPNSVKDYNVEIFVNITNSADVMALLMATDALRRAGCGTIDLMMPYIPYARQDRVCAPGEALSLKVFADLINSQNYRSVEVWDAHSDVALALIDRVQHKKQYRFVNPLLLTSDHDYLVSPDAGSLKKIYEISGGVPVIRADKTRDPETGAITGTSVYCDVLGNKNVLIVDDICDGGRTFIELARVLKGKTYGNIDLYVTHGIFSKGLDVFEGLVDTIYCPNVFPNVPDHKLLVRI